MSLTTASLQPSPQPVADQSADHATSASLLSMLVLSVYAAQKSNRQFRKLRRRFLWTSFKLKMQSRFKRKAGTLDDKILLYILLGILALILVFYFPIPTLIVALTVLILILAGVI